MWNASQKLLKQSKLMTSSSKGDSLAARICRRTLSPNPSCDTPSSAILKQSPLSFIAARREARERVSLASDRLRERSRITGPPQTARLSEPKHDDHGSLRLVRAGFIGPHVHSDPVRSDGVKQTLSSISRAAFSQKRVSQLKVQQQGQESAKQKERANEQRKPAQQTQIQPVQRGLTGKLSKRAVSPWGPGAAVLPPRCTAPKQAPPSISSQQMARLSKISCGEAKIRTVFGTAGGISEKGGLPQQVSTALQRRDTGQSMQLSCSTQSESKKVKYMRTSSESSRPSLRTQRFEATATAPGLPSYPVRISNVVVYAAVKDVSALSRQRSPPRGRHCAE